MKIAGASGRRQANATPTPNVGGRNVFLIEANPRNWTFVPRLRPFVFDGALSEPRVLQQVPCETAFFAPGSVTIPKAAISTFLRFDQDL